MTKQQSYHLEWMDYEELVSKLDAKMQEWVGFSLGFRFELASDQNTDLYITKTDFTKADLKKLVKIELIGEGILEDMDQPDFLETLDISEYQEPPYSHDLFQWMIEKTFGEGTHIAGINERYDNVLLNLATPASLEKSSLEE